MTARAWPVVLAGLVLVLVWYGGAIALNGPQAEAQLAREGTPWSVASFVSQALGMTRPLLPAPHQVLGELARTSLTVAPTDPRSVIYHVAVTGETALAGFLLGTVVGVGLAVGIVHVPVLEASLLPWIVASQTVPILAIAPMAVVILGNLGLTGLLPKAVICAYLSFFPVVVGMVKGLRSCDPLVLDLMRTYSATGAQLFASVRVPSSLPYLFASLKVGVAVSTVGAIVAELPTGGTAGLGARLLAGSYYGQTLQIWAALVAAAVLSLALVFAVTAVEALAVGPRGSRP